MPPTFEIEGNWPPDTYDLGRPAPSSLAAIRVKEYLRERGIAYRERSREDGRLVFSCDGVTEDEIRGCLSISRVINALNSSHSIYYSVRTLQD